MKKRILSLLLCLCQTAAMLHPVALAVPGPSAIRLDAADSFGITGGGVNWVYYGEYSGSPVIWRVLDANNDYDDGTDGTQSALFLLSEYLLDYNSVLFNSVESNTWQGSTAQDWCGDFYSNNFDTAEQSAIAATTKTDSSFTSSTYSVLFAESSDILSSDKVFFLSAEEGETSSYGFSSDSDRIAKVGSSAGSAAWWWLRSPYAGFTYLAGVVRNDGDVYRDYVLGTWSARPAFNLNLSSVLFSSAAEGGKTSGVTGAGALTAVSSTGPTEWKLTLRDSGRAFDVTESAATRAAGSSVTLNYTNAATGPDEYISAMLVDGSSNVLYYGRIKATTAAGDASGTVDVTIPAGLADGSYTLKLFSEQYNGDYKTDYASSFSDVALTVDATAPDAENSFGIKGYGTNWVYYGEYNGSPVMWRVLGATGGNDGAYEDNNGDSINGSEAMFLLSEYLLADVTFDSTGTSNAWQGSTAQGWCGNFYSNNFDIAEQSAIAATAKTDSSFTSSIGQPFAGSSNILSSDKVFFLSAEEAETPFYGFPSWSTNWWWLRSPHEVDPLYAGIVFVDGSVANVAVDTTWSARPAFNLNLSSVLFSSAAEGGKTSGAVGAGALTAVSSTAPTEWKLTLKDSSRSFAVTETAASGAADSSVTLNYANATTGTDEYISAVLVDGSSNVLYYGRIKTTTDAGDANGTVDVTIPSSLAAGNYTLKLFSEQFNGDYETDYASEFSHIALTVTAMLPVTYTVTFNSNGSVYTTKAVNAGQSIGSAAWPTDPTRSSYTFGGWFTGANGAGTQFTSATPVNSTTTVYAKWSYSIGGGGGAPSAPTYTANVKLGNGTETTLPVTVNKDTGIASIDTGSQSLIQGGTVITIPSIPDVDTYSIGIPVPDLSTSSGQGSLTVNTDAGSIAVQTDMLTGLAGTDGSKAQITIGQGNKDNLPDDVKSAIGDKPVIQLTLSVDGKQTDWSNSNAPVTVFIPYEPTAQELLKPEHITVWYIDGSGRAVSMNGHYDPTTSTVSFCTTHFSLYAVVYDPIARLSGTDRIDTALRIAQAAYPDKIANAVLATAYNYPDALAGSVLAYQLNAPILLVGSSEEDQEKIVDYLKTNLEPEGTVYILGGTAVVSGGMENKIQNSGFNHIITIAGGTRYDTSVKIAEQLNIMTGTPVVLVSGENYPDALAVSSIAAQNKFPILLVQKDEISDAVSQEIAAIKPGKVYIIGLEGAISLAVESQAAKIIGLAAEDIARIGGADRYATSLAIAEYFNLGSQTMCVATGTNFPDALAGSVYAAKYKAPIILTDSTLPAQTADYVESRKPVETIIFGGEAVIGKDIEQLLKELTKM